MKRLYEQFLDVPDDLKNYLSSRLLNENYWDNCIDRIEQQALEKRARDWLKIDFANHETRFTIETKIEDLEDVLPIVPKLCKTQGVLFVWTLPAENAGDVFSDAMLYKEELQSIKSSVADNCESLIAQVHIYDDFVFIASVKYYNFISKLPKAERNLLCKEVWETLIDVFKNTTIYAASADILNLAHNLFNGKNIQREPYNKKMLRKLGFVKTPVEHLSKYLNLEDTDIIWKYEHKPCT